MEVIAVLSAAGIVGAGIGGYFVGKSQCPAVSQTTPPSGGQSPPGPSPPPAPTGGPSPPPAPPAPQDSFGVSREPVETRWGGTADLWLRRTGTPVGEWVRVGVIFNATRTLPLLGRWREDPSDNRYDYGAQTEDGVFTEIVTDVPWLWSDSTLETTVLGTASTTWTVRLFDGVGSRSLR